MSFSREQQEVLVAAGAAVLLLRATERVIRLCMTLVFQRQELTLGALQAQEREERKKTLGYFLRELRKRIDLHESFDTLLENFLESRNTFVHGDWGVATLAQAEEAKRFVHTLLGQNDKVLKVFLGLLAAWQEQVGIGEVPPVGNEWFSEVERNYKPLASQIFFAKDDAEK